MVQRQRRKLIGIKVSAPSVATFLKSVKSWLQHTLLQTLENACSRARKIGGSILPQAPGNMLTARDDIGTYKDFLS